MWIGCPSMLRLTLPTEERKRSGRMTSPLPLPRLALLFSLLSCTASANSLSLFTITKALCLFLWNAFRMHVRVRVMIHVKIPIRFHLLVLPHLLPGLRPLDFFFYLQFSFFFPFSIWHLASFPVAEAWHTSNSGSRLWGMVSNDRDLNGTRGVEVSGKVTVTS
ncbi:hypothetical protein IE53DRAFT_1057 [Violaceomyces palustris]|uniref:Uncharacterized protein n=1 Tax=Violaceomyces palustris TaxID=1673888 RepID=A0ACD0P8Q0_9BASI|nr:hypothetical protein IE53DRAFT_1057 [Violaceomyces palustris]